MRLINKGDWQSRDGVGAIQNGVSTRFGGAAVSGIQDR